MTAWITRIVEARCTRLGELGEALGRAVFVCGALEYGPPFLAPLFAFLNTGPAHAIRRLPVYILLVLVFLHSPERVITQLGSSRVDAKAEGEGDNAVIVLAGWLPVDGADGRPDPTLSPWYDVVRGAGPHHGPLGLPPGR